MDPEINTEVNAEINTNPDLAQCIATGSFQQ